MDKMKILLGIAVFLAILLLLIPNRSTRADNLQSPTKIFASLVNQPRSPIIYNEVNLLPTGFGNTISNTDNLIGTGGSSTYRVVAIDDQIFVGQPSISLEAVKWFLWQCHAPQEMQNDGEKIYALSKAYNIDVVFLLGFFYNESTCGTAGASVANHSVGNIICHAQFTCKYDRFAYYDTWIDSVDDWFNLIKNSDYYIKAGHLTLSTIVPIYAPSSDNNDVENYINTVLTEVKMMRTRQYDNIS